MKKIRQRNLREQICNFREEVVRAGCKLLRANCQSKYKNIAAEVCKVARKRTSGLTVNANIFSFLSNKRVYLLHPEKIALANGANKSDFTHFQKRRTFQVKFQKC